jgi:prepilin-type N-terminal cleavage/methylation domain-containing protein
MMTNTLKRRRDPGDDDGFTMIEILIVVVVLGILAAVVIFALGGLTGKTAVAACEADGATIATAIADFNAQNPGTNLTMSGLLNGTTANGNSPYIQSWPDNTPQYAYKLLGSPLQLEISTTPAGAVDASVLANYNPYTTATVSCQGVS